MAIKIKTGNVGNLRETVEQRKKEREKRENQPKGARFATWIPNVDKEDSDPLTVRFLANPDNNGWISYYQAFEPAMRRKVLVTEENEESFEDRGINQSIGWYAPALNYATNEVIIVDIPNNLVENELLRLAAKWGGEDGDFTTFDVELSKTGSGKNDTRYHADFNGASQRDLSELTLPDLAQALENRLEYEQGKAGKVVDKTDQIADEVVDVSEPEEEAPKPRPRRIIKKS
jgi:hypothetical protein